RHEMRGPQPHRQRQLRPVHHRPGGYRRLATAVEAFVGVRPAPQERCASLAAGRTDKPLRPTPLEQERRTARLVRKPPLHLSWRPPPRRPAPPRARRSPPAPGFSFSLFTNQRGPGGCAFFPPKKRTPPPPPPPPPPGGGPPAATANTSPVSTTSPPA